MNSTQFRSHLSLCTPRRFYWHLDAMRRRLKNQRSLRSLRGAHKGERCFIIGNGPSLTVSDLERLVGEVTFAANKIYLIFDKTSWRPRYYVVEDDQLIGQNFNAIRNISGSVRFVNSNWRSHFLGERDIIWYPWHSPDVAEFPRFSGDVSKIVYCGFMVTYISLQLAYFMGFTRVYLLGVDFNYALTYQGELSVEHSLHHPHDHFTPDYFAPGETRYLPRLDYAEMAMRCAREHYEADGRNIWNATRGGKLEIFERANLDRIMNGHDECQG